MSSGGIKKAFYGHGYMKSYNPGVPDTIVDVTAFMQAVWNANPNPFWYYVDHHINNWVNPAASIGKLPSLYVFYNDGKADCAKWNSDLRVRK